jgi:hypothetical protein
MISFRSTCVDVHTIVQSDGICEFDFRQTYSRDTVSSVSYFVRKVKGYCL